MHLYVLTRGILSATKQWENDLAAQYLHFKVLEKGKKKTPPYLAQLAVRPVNLYEIVFPEECLDEVLGMVKPIDPPGKLSKFIKMFSRMMGLKKIPDYKPKITPPGDGVTVTFSNSSAVNTHTFVIIQDGTKDAVAADGITAGPENNWVPPGDPRVIANTGLVGAGVSADVIFSAPSP